MPTPPKRLDNMRKHLTNREKSARKEAEKGLIKTSAVRLRAPKWLSQDARKIWNRVKMQARRLELLDNLDTNALARYCDMQSRFEALAKRSLLTDDQVKEMQAWGRMLVSQEEKLGLSPNARARLAKKKAEAEPVDAMEQLLGSVTEYVNEDR